MIERFDTGSRMSKIVKHNGVAYLCGQVGDGTTVAEQTRDCLSRVNALLEKAGSSREQDVAGHHLAGRHGGFF